MLPNTQKDLSSVFSSGVAEWCHLLLVNLQPSGRLGFEVFEEIENVVIHCDRKDDHINKVHEVRILL